MKKTNPPTSSSHDLFDQRRDEVLRKNAPLADRMRPRTLDEFVGQDHIIGAGRLLRRAIQIDQLSSVIFYGPPGTGKTTLARIIANTTKAQFLSINAVLAGVKDIRESIDKAQKTLALYGRRTILFIDEVHRFNKAQQDALLPHVENGIIILIGATTENPYFEVNKALVSRSRIFQLKQLTEDDLKAVARQALADAERGFGAIKVIIENDALDHLVGVANGDARGVLDALELAVETTKPDENSTVTITRTIAEESIQQRAVLYDRDGDAHYDTISAFIKSVRGSDPDAALYWMAKMLYAGEDPRFIFRRLMILACEDVGMADPAALGVVIDCARAFDYVGLPEGRYHLAHACLYLSTAAKSNSSMAFFDAIKTVSEEAEDDVPDHLRDASRDGDGFGHGEGYLYPHAYRDHWVAQQYLPAALQGRMFYQPSGEGYEQSIKDQVARKREAQLEAMVDEDDSTPHRGGTETGWLERTLGSRGEQLGRLREKLLTLAEVKRSSLVLDLHARTGLLVFEAQRRTPDGGVWALVHDDKALSVLKGMVGGLDTLAQPQLVRTSWETLEHDVQEAAGGRVSFDAIIGRNVLTRSPDQAGFVSRVAGLLKKGGVCALAEVVPSEGQRLSVYGKEWEKSESLVALLQAAEEAVFTDPADPMVSWSVASLEKALSTIEGCTITVVPESGSAMRRITPQDIEYWFRRGDGSARSSLGDRVLEQCDEKRHEELKALLHRKLDYKEVGWKNVTAFVRMVKK